MNSLARASAQHDGAHNLALGGDGHKLKLYLLAQVCQVAVFDILE